MEPKTKRSCGSIPGTNIKLFIYHKAKVKILKNKTVKSMEVNFIILAKMLAISSKQGKTTLPP